jgi:hypothetical protein
MIVEPSGGAMGLFDDFSSVHQCPFCELRFLYSTEVADHIRTDHPDHGQVAEGEHPEAPKR